MVGKMNGKQSTIVLVSLIALLAGAWSFNAWLEQRKTIQIEELKSKDHLAALTELSFANKAQVDAFNKIIVILEEQGEIGKRAIDVLQRTNESLLKAASKSKETIINDVEINNRDANLLRVTPKKRPEPKIVIQQFRIVDINTSDSTNIQVVIMEPETNSQYRVKVVDTLFAGEDRKKLFDALENRETIWAEVVVKEVEGEVKSVQFLRCVDPPRDIVNSDDR
jgi:hypothetical protein